MPAIEPTGRHDAAGTLVPLLSIDGAFVNLTLDKNSDRSYSFIRASNRKYKNVRRAHPYSPQTIDAVRVLGLEVARARRARRWTEAALAERAGISAVTVRNIERGVPTVGIGTFFEVATILGIDLFGTDREGLRSMVERGRERLALLPSRIREPGGPVNDDF